ncbi:LppP/LprE family lipoprotein [Pseudofrankia sp. DC12]|uniref:LppP/LprE family lipoprotein n=1 Tax=Pseudofrankia sp. DC12 TaxID=683315 RepID=UPI0005F879B5|nr:LppP/LprE family lipoprotein [Pseudofrankia sp. DC12]
MAKPVIRDLARRGRRTGEEAAGGRSRGWQLVCGLAVCGLAWFASPGAAIAAASPPASSHTPAAGLNLAVGAVKAAGYTPADTSGYDASRSLSVIIGILTGSADGHPQQAFLFHDGRYVGVDAGVPSASTSWVWSTNDTVALQYQLYRPDDPMCCPTAGATTVRFVWNGTTVKPVDPLPPAGWDAPTSRR